MENFKLFVTLLIISLFICCSDGSRSNKASTQDNAQTEKNKQIIVLNEVGKILQDAQSIEKLGRNMNSYRIGLDAESKRICNSVMEENRRELPALESRINNLPEKYRDRLIPVISELNECVSCSKTATASCIKARASINEIIKEIYP